MPIVGTDFCLPMLLPARDKTGAAAPPSRIRFVEADTQRLPFPDNTFQLTTVAFGLRNVTDTDRGIGRDGARDAAGRPRGHPGVFAAAPWLFGRLYRSLFPLDSAARRPGGLAQPRQRLQLSAGQRMEFPDGEALAEKLAVTA